MSIYLGTEKVSQPTGLSSGDDLSNYYSKEEVNSIISDVDKSVEAVNKKIMQSDWNQEDTTQMDYIKNKPAIGSSTILTNLEIDKILQ